MKILFYVSFIKSITIALSFAEFLRAQKYYLTIITSFPAKFQAYYDFLNIESLDHLVNVDETEYDLYIVFSTSDLITISKEIKNKPIVQCTNTKEDYFTIVPNLYRIITFGYNLSLERWGVPKALVVNLGFLPQSDVKKINEANNRPSLIYFQPDCEPIRVARDIAIALNFLPQYDLKMFVKNNEKAVLEKISNANVRIFDKEDISYSINESDIFIASGEHAIFAIMNDHHVIVLGEYGLGGGISNGNLENFLRIGIKGRIGGVLEEPLPESLIGYEIERLVHLNNSKDETITKKMLKKRVKEILIYPEKVSSLFREITSIYIDIQDPKIEKINLTASLSESIAIQKSSNDSFILMDVSTGKVLAEIGDTENSIIEKLRQKSNIKDVTDCFYGKEKEEVFNFIVDLWKEKYVTFSYL